MKKITSIIIIILFTNCKAQIESNNNKKLVTENVKIYEQASNRDFGPCEPSIFINPKNPKNIVAGSIINYAHHSFDGGKTWKTQKLKSPLGVWGDPCITADKNGHFYYFHLSDPDGTNWLSKKVLDQMVVQKSVDGGKTWSSGTGIGKHPYPKQQDKEWATVNPFNNDIYLTWTEFDKYGSRHKKHKSRILFSKSTDEGQTWSETSILSELEGDAIDDNNTVEGAVPAVGTNGDIFVSWSFNYHIYFDRSSDNGQTWLKKDIVVSNQIGGWEFDVPGFTRVNGMPITCVDLSNSKYKGTIYINFADQRNGADNTDIFLVKSVDNGQTWTKPLRVNNDKTKTHQFFTWMSVDPKTGFIYIVYYGRSHYIDNQTDVVLAISRDGGKTFSNQIISDTPFTPNKNIFFGDYNNINAYNGIVRPIWTRLDHGRLSIWTCLINDN
jgi:hypothetical protein